MGGERQKKKFLVSKWPLQQHPSGAGQRGGPSRRGADQAASPCTSMCFYHAKFCEQAKYCQEGCLWLEN
jgi:hypothetical protein